MRKIVLLCLVMALGLYFCSSANSQNQKQTVKKDSDFKIIGYLTANPVRMDSIPFEYLTHINYAFGIPSKEGDGTLLPIPHSKFLKEVVKTAHQKGVKILLSIGGWNIGDGGGMDTRFEELANSEKSRTTFVHSVMNIVRKFDLDGADIDWEYPDPIEPSSTNFVLLMKELRDSLHPANKKLTAAIVAYHDHHGYGIKDQIFKIADWLNIMAYDDDYNTFGGAHVPHSPYWLDIRCFDYWVNDRGLAKEKAIMGVPFYGKGKDVGMGYQQLLEEGANPYADVYDSIYYNGIKTMKAKTRLALKRGNGIMIWEIMQDVSGQYSLLKAINEVVDTTE